MSLLAKVKTFKAGYGVSFEYKNIWNKLSGEIEVELEEGDDTDKVKELAWNTVKVEVEKQIDELLNK